MELGVDAPPAKHCRSQAGCRLQASDWTCTTETCASEEREHSRSFAPRRPEQHIPFHWNETIQGAFVNQQEVNRVVVNTDNALERHFKKTIMREIPFFNSEIAEEKHNCRFRR